MCCLHARSDAGESLDVTEPLHLNTSMMMDEIRLSMIDYNGCPASPTTVPVKSRSNSSGSQVRSPRPRRQRTTSINQTTTITSSESIIRANNRTIYTAGRPPWYDCAGQQVEPFVIGECVCVCDSRSALETAVL